MNQTPYPSLEVRIEILAGLLALSRAAKIGPVFCECDSARLELGWWPEGVSHMIPPNRRSITWERASEILKNEGVEMKGHQRELELHARRMRHRTLVPRKPAAHELRRAEYLLESGKVNGAVN